jgi:hypothetical protein
MIRRIFLHIAIFSFIALFVYAAIAKLMDFQKFQVQLGQSPMLTRYATVVAWAVPVSELVVAVFIMFERTRLAGLYGAFGLMVMFTTYIVLASRFSDYVPCSCGGILESLGWTEHLIFNSVFVVMACVAVLLQPARRGRLAV